MSKLDNFQDTIELKFVNYEKIEHKIYYLLGFLTIDNFKVLKKYQFSTNYLSLYLLKDEYNLNLFKVLFFEYIEEEEETIKNDVN